MHFFVHDFNEVREGVCVCESDNTNCKRKNYVQVFSTCIVTVFSIDVP